jgi:choline-sulfatase
VAMRRRTFLQGAAATALGPAAWAGTRQPQQRPNILVIMSDEHNAGVTGCYGNPVVQTPNLDGIARRGITFDRCYTNSPLCVPSRMAFTAGKYISRTGAWSNACWLPSDDYPSIARVMTAAGYDALLCGKQHYDATRRYGFTEIARIGNNSYKTGRGGRRRAGNLPKKPTPISARFQDFHTGDSAVLQHDRQVTAGVLDFLRRRRRSERPFFLFAGYLAPHFPLIVPQAYWDAYKGRVAMPRIPPGHLETLPLNYKHLRAGFHLEGGRSSARAVNSITASPNGWTAR